MNNNIRRRSTRRHSLSTLHNEDHKYSAKESPLDVVRALDELRDLNGRIAKRRRVRSYSQNEDNAMIINIKDRPSERSPKEKQNNEKVHLHISSVRNSNVKDQNERDNHSTIVSKDVYDSLMDIKQTLDEIHPDLRRRSERLVAKKKVTVIDTVESIEEKKSSAVGTPSRKSCRELNTLDEAFDAEPKIKRKRMNQSADETSESTTNFNTQERNSIRANEEGTQNFMLENSDLQKIQNYYLDKTVRKTTTSLETIFEDFRSGRSMGRKKIKRLIPFPDIVDIKTNKSLKNMKRLNSRHRKDVDLALESM